MAKLNPGQYIREVRQEISKVTWPTRKETTVTTGMVFLKDGTHVSTIAQEGLLRAPRARG